MLLVQFNISGTTHYLSREGIALERYWDSKIVSFDPIQNKTAYNYGGYVSPSFGGISFFQDLFNAWPPVVECPISLHYNSDSATDTLSATTLFIGTAFLKNLNRESVSYRLFGESFGSGSTIAKGIVYEDVSLESVFDSCAATLGLSVNTSAARSSNTEVYHTLTADKEITSFLSEMSASLCHLYYIDEGTIRLVDMLQNNGTTTITEYDFLPSNYEWNVPSIITSGSSQSGVTYDYGQAKSVNMYVESETSVASALANIWDVWHKPVFNLRMPFYEPLPVTPGLKISWTDTSHHKDTKAWMRVRTVRYDFDNEEIVVTGEGEVSK